MGRLRRIVGVLAAAFLVAAVVRAAGIGYRSTVHRRMVLGFFAVTEGGAPFSLEISENGAPANGSQVVLRSLTVTGPEGVVVQRVEKTPVSGSVYVDPTPLSPAADWLLVQGSLSLSGEGGERVVDFVRRFTRKQTRGLVTGS